MPAYSTFVLYLSNDKITAVNNVLTVHTQLKGVQWN